jgi:hypothetical protein
MAELVDEINMMMMMMMMMMMIAPETVCTPYVAHQRF